MESDDFINSLMCNSMDTSRAAAFYYKGEDGVKYKVNLREYFKLIKIHGCRINISKNMVFQKEISSFFTPANVELLKNEIFLCSSPDTSIMAAYNASTRCMRLYTMFPKVSLLFESQQPSRDHVIYVGISEQNYLYVYCTFRHIFVTFFKDNIHVIFRKLDLVLSEKMILSVSEDTVAVYSAHGKLHFVRCTPELPDFDVWSDELQVFRFTDDVYSKDDDINDEKFICEVVSLNPEAKEKFLVRHFKGEVVAGNTVFIVYFSPKIGPSIYDALKERYSNAGKPIKKPNIIDKKIEILSHTKKEAILAVHCIFNSSEYPDRYYTVITLSIPFFSLDKRKYKTRLGDFMGVNEQTTINSILQNYPELRLNKFYGPPYSTSKYYDYLKTVESVTSIEPLRGGIEYTIGPPNINEIRSLPSLDFKRWFK